MLSQDAAEEQEKGQRVDESACAYMPSRLTNDPGEQAPDEPCQKEYGGGKILIEIVQAPEEDEQGDGIVKEVLPVGMDERMSKDAKQAVLVQRMDAQVREIPTHSPF